MEGEGEACSVRSIALTIDYGNAAFIFDESKMSFNAVR